MKAITNWSSATVVTSLNIERACRRLPPKLTDIVDPQLIDSITRRLLSIYEKSQI
jgi:hypothetical protein